MQDGSVRSRNGREVRTPAKFADVGGLGAAAGPGFTVYQPRLPGISGQSSSSGMVVASTGVPAATIAVHGAADSGPRGSDMRKVLADVDEILACHEDARLSGGADKDDSVSDTDMIDISGSLVRDVSPGGKDIVGGSEAGKNCNDKGKARAAAEVSGTQEVATSSITTLRKSIKRNKDRPYVQWPATLLQQACTLRKISGQSKQRDVGKMASLLQNVDKVVGRPSPFVLDLRDKAAGGTPPSAPPASGKDADSPPNHLVVAVRTAIVGGMSPHPGKMYDGGDGKSYTLASILAVMKEEDGVGRGSPSPRMYKSKHCIPRATELMVDERWRPGLATSRLQLSKNELDGKQTGKSRTVNISLWEVFKDEKVLVAQSLANDEHVIAAGIDPNVVHQPDISFDKFMSMIKDVKKSYGERDHNFTKSGSNGEWHPFCNGDMDAYYFGILMRKYPEILAVCDQMLPADVQRENTGVGGSARSEGGAEAAAANAAKREAAKRKAQTNNAHLSKREGKEARKEKEAKVVVKVAIKACKEEWGMDQGLGGIFGGPAEYTLADAPTSWYDTKEGVDSSAAKIDLSQKLFESLLTAKKHLAAEKAKGEDANPEDVGYLHRKVKQIRKRLAEDA